MIFLAYQQHHQHRHGRREHAIDDGAPVERLYRIKGREIQSDTDRDRDYNYGIKRNGPLRLARKTDRLFFWPSPMDCPADAEAELRPRLAVRANPRGIVVGGSCDQAGSKEKAFVLFGVFFFFVTTGLSQIRHTNGRKGTGSVPHVL
jgi:hypothetical protein